MASKTKKFEAAKATAASSSGASNDWKRWSWLPSTVTAESLKDFIADGLVLAIGWRIPGLDMESEPVPHYNERVVLIQFIKQGFSLPAHLFVRDLLRYYRAQLHHLTPNGVAHIACFITPCESFLGTEPYWGSWKNIFCAKP